MAAVGEQCRAVTNKGSRCSRRAVTAEGYCRQHYDILVGRGGGGVLNPPVGAGVIPVVPQVPVTPVGPLVVPQVPTVIPMVPGIIPQVPITPVVPGIIPQVPIVPQTPVPLVPPVVFQPPRPILLPLIPRPLVQPIVPIVPPVPIGIPPVPVPLVPPIIPQVPPIIPLPRPTGGPPTVPTIPPTIPRVPTLPPITGLPLLPPIGGKLPTIPPLIPTIPPTVGPLAHLPPKPSIIPTFTPPPKTPEVTEEILNLRLKLHNLSLRGTYPEKAARLTRREQNPGPYRDIGNFIYGLPPGLTVGQEYTPVRGGTIGVLGEGSFDVQHKPYDPDIKPTFNYKVLPGINKLVPFDFTSAAHCRSLYQIDPITQEDIGTIDRNELYVDETQRCYHIPGILQKWESGFALYDEQKARIVPQYPLDFDNTPVPPTVIRNVWATARARGLELQNYRLLRALVNKLGLLEALYDFIITYQELIRAYEQIYRKNPEAQKDSALWNRRDITAANWMGSLYHHFFPAEAPGGFRKYNDVLSTREGPQISYQCFLTKFFGSEGFRTINTNEEQTEFMWRHWPGNPPEDYFPMRSCFSQPVIL